MRFCVVCIRCIPAIKCGFFSCMMGVLLKMTLTVHTQPLVMPIRTAPLPNKNSTKRSCSFGVKKFMLPFWVRRNGSKQ